MICSAPSVNRGSTSYGIGDLGARGFSVVNANPGAGIRLESPILGSNSQNEVKHKGTRVDPGGDVALVS
jgi:hypothetical protein